MRNKIGKKLERFQYKYMKKEKSIIVNLGLKQEIIINFLEDEKIEITDKLKSWNILTGFFEMSLKKALVYQFISIIATGALLLCAFVFLGLDEALYFIIIGIVLIFAWGTSIYWTNYYHIKAESFKRTLINWLDEK